MQRFVFPLRQSQLMRRAVSVTIAMLVAIVGLLATTPATAADAFTDDVLPFTQKYCVQCHNSKESRGELDLSGHSRIGEITRDFRRWNHIVEFIRGGDMPPEDAKRQPSIEERNAAVEALETILLAEARKHAGDPGAVPPRRLSNTEYDLSIRDLTGVDIQPTRDFPADPAAGEGFNNTGEALTMSPSLLKKYLGAAQQVSHHLVLKTNGITFSQFPVTSYNERKKLTEQAIIDFYQNHEVRIAEYLEAAWRYRYREDRNTSIESWAQQRKLSGRYLSSVWKLFQQRNADFAYLKDLRDQWDTIPAPTDEKSVSPELRQLVSGVEFCRATLGQREERLIRSNAGNWPISHLDFRSRTAAVRDRFDASRLSSNHLVRFDRIRVAKDKSPETVSLYLRVEPAIADGGDSYVVLQQPVFSKNGNLPNNDKDRDRHEVVTLRSILERHAPQAAKRLAFGRHPRGREISADSIVLKAPALIEIPLNPDAMREVNDKHLLVQCQLDAESSPEGSVHLQYSVGRPPETGTGSNVQLLMHADSELAKKLAESADLFCRVFPNRFFYVDDKRGLAAGFHLVEGFFRDDKPLVEHVLDETQRHELDQLWEELNFVTQSAETLIRGFVWFERSERHVLHDKRFDFLRPEDPLLVEDELLTRFEKVYLDKMGVKLIADTLKPENPSDKYTMIHGFFEQIRKGLAHQRALLKTAEQQAQDDLVKIAEKAYRRVLRPVEVTSLQSLYSKLRKQGQGVEESLRGVFVAVLMSPDFCYRYWEAPSGAGITALTNKAIASRLSYFLWSSLPDEELLQAARSKQLTDEAELLDQTRRMLKDPKVKSFAREFFGQWLRYRDYLTNDPIIADAFPGYTDELRTAMFEEPTRLVTWLIREDKPLTNLLDSDVTFVNAVLAKHYGGDIARQFDASGPEWQQVRGLRKSGRGGLFGMGLILTKNSGGERTSPVKRGFWTVHHLLGQHFPPPPADVPELPPNEKEATKTIRELIAEHTANAKCAMCHKHFDSLGMALEGFDPIGRARTKDLAGREIDNVAVLPDGKTAQGIPGLMEYVRQHRQRDFIRTMCRKFLGYALGRSVRLSDKPLLMKMEAALEASDHRFSVLFETVVKSPQFRNQRGREYVADRE